MGNSFSLDDIRAAAERKYGSTDIVIGEQTVRLLNPLRVPKVKRDELFDLLGKLKPEDEDGSDDIDAEHVIDQALRLVAQTDEQGAALLNAVSGDLAIMKEIFEKYIEGVNAGEASPSQS